MSRSSVILVIGMLVLAVGMVSAYTDLGGGWCGCGTCNDCTTALADDATCSVGVIADGAPLTTSSTCIGTLADAGGKVIDLNGSTITDEGAPPYLTAIALDGDDNVLIVNGTINNAYFGVHFNDSDNVVVRNVTITSCVFYGVLALDSTDNLLLDDMTVGLNTGIAIGINGSNDAEIKDSEIGINGMSGVVLAGVGSGGHQIHNNSIYGCGTIISPSYGIRLWDVTDCEIWNNSISIIDKYGIALTGASDNLVYDTEISLTDDGSNTAAGVICISSATVANPANNEFRNVTVHSILGNGFAIGYCANTTITGSEARNNTEAGVFLSALNPLVWGELVNSTVYDTISHNNTYGFGASAVSNVTFDEVEAYDNVLGLFIYNSTQGSQVINSEFRDNYLGGGLWLYATNHTYLYNLEIHDNLGDGLLHFATNDSSMDKVHFYDNGLDAYFYGSGYPGNFTATNFVFDRPAGDYNNFTNLTIIDYLPADNQFMINWTGAETLPAGNLVSFRNKFVRLYSPVITSIDSISWVWQDWEEAGYMDSQFQLLEHSGSWSDTGAALDTAANTLTLTNWDPSSNYSIVQNLSACPVITSGGAYQLQADLSGAPNAITTGGLTSACIIIDSDDVHIDCNGYNIMGTGAAGTAGIVVNGSLATPLDNVTIEGCTVGNYGDYATFFTYAQNSAINGSSLYSNVASSWALYVDDSTNFNATNNELFNSSAGLGISDTTTGNITNNNIYNNTQYGVRIQQSTGLEFAYNRVHNNSGTGVNFGIDSDSNHFMYNNFSNNTGHGMNIQNASDNTFAQNRFYNNGRNGLYLYRSEAAPGAENIFMDNYYYNNTYSGLNVSYSNYAWFQGSLFMENTIDGAYLYNATEIEFVPYTAGVYTNRDLISAQNGMHGIHSDDCSDLALRGGAAFTLEVSYNQRHGIFLSDTNDSFVDGNAALYIETYNNSLGLGGWYGVLLDSSYNNMVRWVESYNQTAGVMLGGDSQFNQIIDNLAYDNTEGFWAYESGNNTFVLNEAYNNSYGFYNEPDAHSNNYTSNIAAQNIWGFYLINSHNVLFNDSYTAYNGYDFMVGTDSSFNMTNCVFTQPGPTLGRYTNLTVEDVVQPFEEYYINWTSNSTALPGGTVSFAGKFVEIVENGPAVTSIDELVWNWVASEEAGYTPADFILWKHNATAGWTKLNNTPDLGARTLSQYNMNPSSTYGILQYNITSCLVINTPGTYNVAADLVGAPFSDITLMDVRQACIMVASSDVVVDCNGFSITNDGTGDAGAIVVNGSATMPYDNVTITNCPALHDYKMGAYVEYATDVVVAHTSAYNNTNSGFYSVFANDSVWLNDTSYNNSLHGFTLNSGTYLEMYNNTVYNNSQHGFDVDNIAWGTFDNLTSYNNTYSGMYLYNCRNNTFSNSRFFNNSNYGIHDDTNDGTDIKNNTFSYIEANGNQRHGMYIETRAEKIYHSLAFENVESGIVLDGVNGGILNNDTANNNGDDGFHLDNADYTTITDCIAHDNADEGVYLHSGSAYNTITNLRTYENLGHGLRILQSNFNNVTGSVAANNTGYGFDAFDGNDLVFANNLAYNNTYGFRLGSAEDSIINDSEAYWNGRGVYCDRTDDITFNRIESYNNTGDGLQIYSAENVVFNDTILYNNAVDFRVRDTTLLGASFVAEGMVFLNPAGTYVNYTNLTIADSALAEEYTINWTLNSSSLEDAVSFENKWVNITTVAGAPSIDELVWHWIAGEEAGYTPSLFKLMEYGTGSWDLVNATPNTGARTLSAYALNPSSDYGILQFTENITIDKELLNPQIGYAPGAIVEFQLTVNNTGNLTLYNVSVVDELPSNLTYTSSNQTATQVGQVINWSFASLAPGASKIILLNATVVADPSPGVIWNDANVSGTSQFGSVYTNSSNASVPIESSGLYVVKTATPTSGTGNFKVEYTINITNIGTINLTVSANDTLPAGVTFIETECSPANTSSSGNTLYWDNLELNLTSGNSTIIQYNATMSGTSGTKTNTVVAFGEPATGDNVTATNSSSVVKQTTSSGDDDDEDNPMHISASSPRIVGDEITLTVTSGGSPVSNAEVTVCPPAPGSCYDAGLTTGLGLAWYTPSVEGEHTAYATRSGYDDAETDFYVVDGGGECMVDSDCPDCHICILGATDAYNQCVLAPEAECAVHADCEGYAKKPTETSDEFPTSEEESDSVAVSPIFACLECSCEEVECLTNEDCPEGQECIDYECTGGDEPPAECVTDADCSSTQHCVDGDCQDVPCFCGEVIDHECNLFECCNNMTCVRLYNESFFCNLDVHECEEIPPEPPEEEQPIEVDVPEETGIGDEVDVTVTSGGNPVGGADVSIYLDGEPYGSAVTDANGNADFIANDEGEYTVVVTKPGFASGEDRVTATTEAPGSAWESIISGVWLLLFLLIVAAIIYVLYTKRKKKRRPKA